MTAQILATALHVPIVLSALKHYQDEPVWAIGLATSISSLIKLIMVFTFGAFSEKVRDSYISLWWTFFSRPNGQNTRNDSDMEFFSITLPSMLMFCAEGWAFYLFTFIAVYISVEDQDVAMFCMLTCTTLFMLTQGLQEASSALVGNMIGANRVGFAWHYAQTFSAMTMIFAFLLELPLFMNIDKIASWFTSDPVLQNMMIEVLPVVFISFFFDAI